MEIDEIKIVDRLDSEIHFTRYFVGVFNKIFSWKECRDIMKYKTLLRTNGSISAGAARCGTNRFPSMRIAMGMSLEQAYGLEEKDFADMKKMQEE